MHRINKVDNQIKSISTNLIQLVVLRKELATISTISLTTLVEKALIKYLPKETVTAENEIYLKEYEDILNSIRFDKWTSRD